MINRLLYDYAREMLETTNVYHKPIEALQFRDREFREVQSLLGYLRGELRDKKMSSDKRDGDRINKERCFLAISEAMEDFASEYPSCYSFRRQIRSKFHDWLEAIIQQYR